MKNIASYSRHPKRILQATPALMLCLSVSGQILFDDAFGASDKLTLWVNNTNNVSFTVDLLSDPWTIKTVDAPKLQWSIVFPALQSIQGYQTGLFYVENSFSNRNNVTLLFKDFHESEKAQAFYRLKTAYEASTVSSKQFVFAVRGPEGNVDCRTVRDFESLSNNWLRTTGEGSEGGGARFLISEGIAAVEICPSEARARAARIVRDMSIENNDLSTLYSIDKTFGALESQNLMNDTVDQYAAVWASKYRPGFTNGVEADFEPKAFQEDILFSLQRPDLCTITVNTSSPVMKATVEYAKEADAERGVFLPLGETTVIKPVEKAIYWFRASRNGRVVGEETNVSCEGEFQPVLIKEN